ncbi:uncharacterized protein LOC117180307 isoform X2 [Belonocnema kinseyi]|uniref:uncharacterized protein LOC117180307 isoform X2 n=1 Tax=Belonocnema kinseyi TaxID=2817044 RepID=UPI00143D0093|nr:uncharacterized protein LOC117180307 isoform X2 [Belonocnema kinseyi]
MNENSKKLSECLSTVAKALSCYECKNICTEPWVIRCGHSFCKKCIQDLRNSNRNCPRCDLQPITRRGVVKNEELEKVINQFYKLQDAFKTDTQFKFTQDRFVPSPMINDSKNSEENTLKTPINNVRPSSGQDSKIALARKNSIPETEYFRRFKSSTFKKNRVDSNKSLTMNNKRSSDKIEDLPDEEVDGPLSSVEVSRTTPERKSSIPDTEYFRSFKNLSLKKNRIDSDQSPIRDETYSDEVESLRDEAESLADQNEEEQSLKDEGSQTLSSHDSDLVEFDENPEEQSEEEQSLIDEESQTLSSQESDQVESDENQSLLSHESDLFESDVSFEEQTEEEQNLISEENQRLLSQESDLFESDDSHEEQTEEEQSLISEENQRLLSQESDLFESDDGLEEQTEEEQSLIYEENIRFSSHESDLLEFDESLEAQTEADQSLTYEENIRFSSPEPDLLEFDESLEEQTEVEQSLVYEENIRFSGHESDLLEFDESLGEENEKEQALLYEGNLRLSSHKSALLESDESLEEQKEEEQTLTDTESISFSSYESGESLEEQNEEEQSLISEESQTLSRHESDLLESDESLEEQSKEEQSLLYEENLRLSSNKPEVFESDKDQEVEEDEEYPDSPIKSVISTSSISDEIETYDLQEISIEMDISSDNGLHTEEMVFPLVFPFPDMDQTVCQSSTETEPLEQSMFYLKSCSAVAGKDLSNTIHSIDMNSPSACESPKNIYSTNFNHTSDLESLPIFDYPQSIHTKNLIHTLDMVSSPAFDSQNVHRKFLRKEKKLDDIFNSSGRRKHIPFAKAARTNDIRKKVLFHYCGKLSYHYKSLVDKDILTVLSPGEIKNNLPKKSPMNRKLLDFGFKIFQGNLNPDTLKLNGSSHLGKRKRSVSKAKNVIDNFEGDTTEDLSDYLNKLDNDVDKQRPFSASRNVSITSESELSTESFSVRQMRVENKKTEEKFKMLGFPSVSGTDSLHVEPQFLNLDLKQENRVGKINHFKSQLLPYSPVTNHIVSQKLLSRVEDLEERPIERIRASVENDNICESFHIEKFVAFREENQNECTFEDGGDNHVDKHSILLADGSRTPRRSSFIGSRDNSLEIFEKKFKPSRVIILSSDDEDSSKKQDYLVQTIKQEPSSPLKEPNTKIKTIRRIRHTDSTFGWRVRKKVAKE